MSCRVNMSIMITLHERGVNKIEIDFIFKHNFHLSFTVYGGEILLQKPSVFHSLSISSILKGEDVIEVRCLIASRYCFIV